MNIITPGPREFAVLGGDLRQVCLAQQLVADRHVVYTYANELREHSSADKPLHEVSSPGALPKGCTVVLPLPSFGADGMLNAPLSAARMTAEELMEALAAARPASPVFAGKVSAPLHRAADRCGIELADYYDREELTVANAAATAEAAVALAADLLPITLGSAKALVVGFGRIGKLLTLRLGGMGCRVTASARKHGDLAWAEALGAQAIRTAALAERVQDFDVIFNTVPARVLDCAALERVKRSAVVIDLASAPGGLDLELAKKLGVNAVFAPGLPGKTSPATAGAIIRDSIYNILNERRDSI